MIRGGEASLDAAAERLSRAVEALEAKVAAQAARAAEPPAPVDESVHIELREARMRERALEGAAVEASAVLGRAAERIRSALEDDTSDADFAPDDDPDEQLQDEGDESLDHLSDDQTDLHPHQREF